MLGSNPVRDTARDYPWAKVFFGFVGGMILCNLAVNLLASIKIIVATVMQVSLADVEMDEPVLSVLLHFLFPFSVLLCSVATAVFLVWRDARRNHQGIAWAVKFMLAAAAGYSLLRCFYFVFWGEFSDRAQILLLIFSYVPFILMQGVIAALLASWLLPESVANEAKPYPWRRVILGFGLCTGLLNGLLFWLLLLAQGEGVSLGHLLDNIARFFTPGFLFGAWFAWRRFQRSPRDIIYILAVTLPLAMFYFMDITAGSFSYSMYLRSLPMILTARLALPVLILSLVFLPAREDETASKANYVVLLVVGILTAAVIIVVSAWIMPYVLSALWQLLLR